jgi:serine/threonine protein kinase
MNWKSTIREELKDKQAVFSEIIQNFDSSGEIVFRERNTLRKIHHLELGTLAVKSFKKPHLINQVAYAHFRKSKAFRSFHHAETLTFKNINTPKPLAFFEERRNGRLLKSFYFSEYYEYDFTFRELIENKELFPDWNSILRDFSRFVFTIHENSILFKDLSPGNVLIKKTEHSYHFSLIDLNRMLFRTLTMEERLQNFIRLSLTDEMISIIGKEYALLTRQDDKKVSESLRLKNLVYIRKKERKKNIKKLLGKS